MFISLLFWAGEQAESTSSIAQVVPVLIWFFSFLMWFSPTDHFKLFLPYVDICIDVYDYIDKHTRTKRKRDRHRYIHMQTNLVQLTQLTVKFSEFSLQATSNSQLFFFFLEMPKAVKWYKEAITWHLLH